MVRKLLIVWNPVSGGRSKRILKELTKTLGIQNIQYVIADTRETKNATITVSQALDESFTDLVIIGGDGTINESINGLRFDIPVSIIPAGTGDDFAKMVHLGSTVAEKINTAVNGKIQKIDLGLCNDRKFINGIGIGFDGQIVEDMIAKRVPLLKGHAAYYYHVLRILGGYKERRFIFHVDNQRKEKDLILLTIGNGSTFGGGFRLMPGANIYDGLLEVCEIGKISGIRRFLNIHKLSNGTHDSLSMVNLYQVKQMAIEENPLLFAHIDGERLGNPPFSIKVLSQALQLRIKKQ